MFNDINDPFDIERSMMQQLSNGPFGMFNSFLFDSAFPQPGTSQLNTNFQPFSMSPFNLMPSTRMTGMEDLFSMPTLQNSPHSMSFSSSTMISYDGNGQSRVVQSSVRRAGDVQETRRSVRDGNVEHSSVGHAIGDRAHVVEKKRDTNGRVQRNQRFVNLDESEAKQFDDEFAYRLRRPFDNRVRPRAIQSGNDSELVSNYFNRYQTRPQRSVPIIDIPDDDVQEEPRPRSNNNRTNGPIIREVTDDEIPSVNVPKRRRGV